MSYRWIEDRIIRKEEKREERQERRKAKKSPEALGGAVPGGTVKKKPVKASSYVKL